MAAATTLCSTGAAVVAGRGSIDTSGAGGWRCPFEPRPRPRRRFRSRTRGRRSAMGAPIEDARCAGTGDGTAARARPAGDADRQPASAGTRRLTAAHSGLTSSVLDVAQTRPAYRTPEQEIRSAVGAEPAAYLGTTSAAKLALTVSSGSLWPSKMWSGLAFQSSSVALTRFSESWAEPGALNFSGLPTVVWEPPWAAIDSIVCVTNSDTNGDAAPVVGHGGAVQALDAQRHVGEVQRPGVGDLDPEGRRLLHVEHAVREADLDDLELHTGLGVGLERVGEVVEETHACSPCSNCWKGCRPRPVTYARAGATVRA